MKRQHKLTNYFNSKVMRKENQYEAVSNSSPAEEVIASTSTSKEDITVNKIINYPEVWTEQRWLERKEKHKWLICKNGLLGCSDCSAVKVCIKVQNG